MAHGACFVSGIGERLGRDGIDGGGPEVARVTESLRHQPLPHEDEYDRHDDEGDAEARNLLGHGALVLGCKRTIPASGARS
jgi:hypothetical protein